MLKSNALISLVGAGPGDPDLLTLKAYRLIQQADVIVYDRLVSEEIRELIPHGVKKIYVGKASGKHHMNQDEINELLVKLAKKDRKIVRLKGGDPFIFGRGSEEASYLVKHNIDFEYVPGITAASACSAYAGIPLTHRGVASSVRLITGHCRADKPLDLNWKSLADKDTTLVFYMGLASLPQLRKQLIEAGLSADTPAAAIENGTKNSQRRCLSTLDQLPTDVIDMSISSPALIIIGNVVNFAEELDWFSTATDTLEEGIDVKIRQHTADV
ncbi:MAG: uroporphyrinogen-III C-methyltransferase [Gammaproteobacteria bacterium]|nr:uroporphyrinogen-III C-methyltransferase [Gammaproteobacteria bacterium]